MPEDRGFVMYAQYGDGSKCPLYTSDSEEDLLTMRPSVAAQLHAEGLTADIHVRPATISAHPP